MDIFIDPDSDVGLAKQIYEAVRSAILDARFSPGDRLPPTRELAASLGVSRHTVTTAYGHLTAEGYLEGRSGGGTVVSGLFALNSPEVRDEAGREVPLARPVEDFDFDLRPGSPDPRLFPTAEWRRHTAWAVDEHQAVYGDPAGRVDFRGVLARWIFKSRGVETSVRDLIVTSGAQQAFYLLLGACVSPGSKVAMEDPGYERFREVASIRGLDVVPVPVDDQGLVVEAIPHDVEAVYVTPSHQYPTGVTMSMARRLELHRLAGERDFIIIEDDYDSEFRYVDRPLEPLYRLDRSGRVSYVASFSKTLSPAIRAGFVVTPPSMTADVLSLRANVDWAPSQMVQLALRSLIADGEFDRHLARTRKEYRVRHDLLADWLRNGPARPFLDPYSSHAGLHIAVRLAPSISESAVVTELADRGVGIDGLSKYVAGNGRGGPEAVETLGGHGAGLQGLVIGLGLVDEAELQTALGHLEDVLAAA